MANYNVDISVAIKNTNKLSKNELSVILKLVMLCKIRLLTNIEDLRKSGFSDKYIPSFKVLNPMSLDQEYFRPSLRSSILNTLANNRLLIEKEGVKIFEIGKVFLEFNKEESSYLPNEKEFLAGLFQGSKGPDSWNVNKEEIDFFDAKGVIEQLFLKLNFSNKKLDTYHIIAVTLDS